MSYPPTSAILLAGGQSRRLGQDKALLDLGQGPNIVRIAALLKELCSEVILVTDFPGRYSHLGMEVRWAHDRLPGQGPLVALEAGLEAATHPFALAVACDLPFLNVQLLRYMLEKDRDYDALVPRWRGKWHPLHAIYARRALAQVRASIARGERSLEALLPHLQVHPLRPQEIRRIDPKGLSLFNLNTPQGLAWARRVAGLRS